MKDKKSILITVGASLVVRVASFFAGTKVAPKQEGMFTMSQDSNGRFTTRAGQMRGEGGTVNFQGGNTRNMMRPVSGEVLSQDENSVTVKEADGSSKIVILSDKTSINKTTSGSKTDLKTGEKITAFGTSNSDGSITAENISIGGIGGGMMMRAVPAEIKK